jgi:hypothetical protein
MPRLPKPLTQIQLVAASGNRVESFTLPCVTYGQNTIRKGRGARGTVWRPGRVGKARLREKKAALNGSDNPRYARMLSSFAYSAFDESACLCGGVAHRRVNPAYTSIIGRVKFAHRYGLSVHEAASVTIAQRAMGCTERLLVRTMAPSMCRRTALSVSPLTDP